MTQAQKDALEEMLNEGLIKDPLKIMPKKLIAKIDEYMAR
jgi:hypothetical protein